MYFWENEELVTLVPGCEMISHFSPWM